MLKEEGRRGIPRKLGMTIEEATGAAALLNSSLTSFSYIHFIDERSSSPRLDPHLSATTFLLLFMSIDVHSVHSC